MKRTILAATLLCLTACNAPSSVMDSAAIQSRLSPVPVSIPKGLCAVVLAPRGGETEAVFFQILGRRAAYIALDNKQQRLTLKRANNKLGSGLWLKQDLEGHRLSVSLTLRTQDTGKNATLYRGVISLTKPTGWSNAIAVEGKIKCQNRS